MLIHSQALKTTHGFTLIEVMVALLIFSIGLLGLVGLQSTAIQDNSRSFQRLQANLLAYDMLDRMRTNRAAAIAGNYDIGTGNPPTATACIGSTTCDSTQMANHDRREWKLALDNALPDGDGIVTRLGAGSDDTQVRITVQWNDQGDTQSITITAEL